MTEVDVQASALSCVPQALREDLSKLDSRFFGNPEFSKAERELLLADLLTKRGRSIESSNDTEYAFFLFTDMLAYAKKIPIVPLFNLHVKIPIDSSFDVRCLMPSEEDPYRILVVSSIKSFVISFYSELVRDTWLAAFAQCIAMFWQQNPDSARGVFASLPPWLSERDIPYCELLFGFAAPDDKGAQSRAVFRPEQFSKEALLTQAPLAAMRAKGSSESLLSLAEAKDSLSRSSSSSVLDADDPLTIPTRPASHSVPVKQQALASVGLASRESPVPWRSEDHSSARPPSGSVSARTPAVATAYPPSPSVFSPRAAALCLRTPLSPSNSASRGADSPSPMTVSKPPSLAAAPLVGRAQSASVSSESKTTPPSKGSQSPILSQASGLRGSSRSVTESNSPSQLRMSPSPSTPTAKSPLQSTGPAVSRAAVTASLLSPRLQISSETIAKDKSAIATDKPVIAKDKSAQPPTVSRLESAKKEGPAASSVPPPTVAAQVTPAKASTASSSASPSTRSSGSGSGSGSSASVCPRCHVAATTKFCVKCGARVQ